jgi:hypothetical protein
MPLHDWNRIPGWDGVHQVWGVELLYALKKILPAHYRAYIGTTPTFAIGTTDDPARPDVGVRDWSPTEAEISTAAESGLEPDEEVAVATLGADTALFVERAGRLVTAIELISPRNKDRTAAQIAYTDNYCAYLLRSVNLLLIDVHRSPAHFAFPAEIAKRFNLTAPPLPAPCAVAYRTGGPAPSGGRFLAVWRRALSVGTALPTITLPLANDESVAFDLESPYSRATEALYIS